MEDYMTAISITIEDLGVKKRDFEIEGKVFTFTKPMAGHELEKSQIMSKIVRLQNEMAKMQKQGEENLDETKVEEVLTEIDNLTERLINHSAKLVSDGTPENLGGKEFVSKYGEDGIKLLTKRLFGEE
jgi:hypothetical protein